MQGICVGLVPPQGPCAADCQCISSAFRRRGMVLLEWWWFSDYSALRLEPRAVVHEGV